MGGACGTEASAPGPLTLSDDNTGHSNALRGPVECEAMDQCSMGAPMKSLDDEPKSSLRPGTPENEAAAPYYFGHCFQHCYQPHFSTFPDHTRPLWLSLSLIPPLFEGELLTLDSAIVAKGCVRCLSQSVLRHVWCSCIMKEVAHIGPWYTVVLREQILRITVSVTAPRREVASLSWGSRAG
jgi:hypothetical protein